MMQMREKRNAVARDCRHSDRMPLFPRWPRFGSLLLAAASLAHTLAEPPASPLPNHCEFLRRMPVALFDYAGTLPEADSSVAPDRAASPKTPPQLGAAMKLALAAAHNDPALADDCWGAVNSLFAHQTKAGDFGTAPASAAFSLCDLTRSLLVVQQSPLAGHFQDRIDALKPALVKAAHWLTAQHGRLLWEDRAAPDRLFSDAEAFLFCGRLLDDPALVKIGRQFLERGMKSYRPADGVFLENNGPDTNAQAATLVRLQEIVLHFPDRQVEASIAKAAQWELAQIAADGAVRADGSPHAFPGSKMLFPQSEKRVNAGEITLGMLYYHERTGDPAALATAEKLHQHYTAPH